jgi:putative transposase
VQIWKTGGLWLYPGEILQVHHRERRLSDCTYQAQFLHDKFPVPLNVVILVKTNHAIQASGHIILFTSAVISGYPMSYWSIITAFASKSNSTSGMLNNSGGLEDFMNVTPTDVTNAANLSLLLVILSQVLMCDFRQSDPDFGVLDLKSYFRGCRYASELLKILPEKPDDILIAQLFRQMATLGSIHVAKSPVFPS